MKKHFAGIVLLLSLVLVPSLVARAEAQSEQMKGAEEVPMDQMLANVETLAAAIEKSGAQLLAVFKDTRRPSGMRLRCALALGRLKYLPAIQELIAQIDLYDEERITTESAMEVMYPCVRALAEYGIAIIPETVSAYMKEENAGRKRLLATAITLTKNREMAVSYAKGLAAGAAGAQASKEVKSLIEALR